MKKAFSHKVPQNIGRTRKAGFLRWFSLRGRFRNPNRAKRSAALPLPRPYWQSAQPSSAQWRKAFHEKTQLPGMMVKPYTVDSGNSLASYRMQSCDWIGFFNLIEFSIRAPVRGATHWESVPSSDSQFQSTLPARRARIKSDGRRRSVWF